MFDLRIDKDIGDFFKIRFGFPKSVEKAEWKLKYLEIVHPKNKDMFKTECNLHLIKSPTQDSWQEIYVSWPDFPTLSVVNYYVEVHTSLRTEAMDSGAEIVLYGDYGNSGRRQLKNQSDDKFQPGQVDKFSVPVVKLGQVRKVRLINSLDGNETGWNVDKVVVKEDPKAEKEWVFECGRFFDPTKGDGKFDRILRPGGKEPEDPEPEPVRGPKESSDEEEEQENDEGEQPKKPKEKKAKPKTARARRPVTNIGWWTN